MAKQLGRGLDSILRQSVTNPVANATNNIAIENIIVNSSNPRTSFDQEALEELADSIKQVGIIQPVTVREISGGKYQIVSGERRYRASILAGLKQIPAFVRQVGDEELLKIALLENIQREDLNALDIAISYQRMIDELSLTQDEVSKKVSKKRATVANYLRLLKLPAEIQKAIQGDFLSMGHARALVNIEDSEWQIQLLNEIIENGLSVRQVEALVKQKTQPVQPENTVVENAQEEKDETNEQSENPEKVVFIDPNPPVVIPDTENESLRERFGKYFSTKVDLKRDTSGAGRITIHFRTDDEFQHILQLAEKISENG
ncbi:MAG: ParB/RepB/Spo0J family partition protein [Bacteroidales bacterium]|jgi:ParB family chromosome partitioning protein|nr:ParB/RepB/Spo0J family partition protein [Bacteroidales bacterium]